MKARIKKTGEIVIIADYATIALDLCDSWGNPIELKPEEIELINDDVPTEDFHWQDVRERAAIAALQGCSSNPNLVYGNAEEKIDMVCRAMRYADELVKQLKGE